MVPIDTSGDRMTMCAQDTTDNKVTEPHTNSAVYQEGSSSGKINEEKREDRENDE
jgi:hypothetical protein